MARPTIALQQAAISSYPNKWPFDLEETYNNHVGELNSELRSAIQIGASLLVRCTIEQYDEIDRLLQVLKLVNQAWILLNHDEDRRSDPWPPAST